MVTINAVEQPAPITNKQLKQHAWQTALADLVTDPKELIDLLELDQSLVAPARQATQLFPLKVPRRFLRLIEKRNLNDPLLKQILPLGIEAETSPAYTLDPLQEKMANPVAGLIQKYHGRVLVTLTSACAVHCRYCFRRHFPYADNNPGTRGWDQLLDYIRADQTITEVIVSGGDPLAVSDKLLRIFTDKLSEIKHIRRFRIHTRIPIYLPERITDQFIAWIKSLRFSVVVVIHANHPREISPDVFEALQALRAAGVTLLNQSVLLRGVNDHVDTLSELSDALFAAGVLPYYLHTLDKVQGAQHFDLPRSVALSLHAEMQKRLPGYLVPRLACEEPGELSKTLLHGSLE